MTRTEVLTFLERTRAERNQVDDNPLDYGDRDQVPALDFVTSADLVREDLEACSAQDIAL